MKNPKIIFISHTFPPTVGGVETQNFELSHWLAKHTDVLLIANRRGRKFLPLFAIYSLFKTLANLSKYDVILLGSGVISINGWILKLFTKKPIICVVHGLDINYNSSSLGVWYEKLLITIYQNLWTKVFLPKIDRLIAVGNETIRVGLRHGLHKDKFIFIPNGVDTDKHLVEANRQDLEKVIGQSAKGKKILLTTGRLAKRKGVAWFIRNVLPHLSSEYIYVVAGSGPDRNNIEAAIKETAQQERVFLLGFISDENRNALWNSADLFLQPNIKVEGDLEGFGISVIEAGSCRLPVLASGIEGLKDAIKDGNNGFLVESQNSKDFINKIEELFSNGSPREKYGEKVRDFVVKNYHWNHICQLYLTEIKNVIKTN